MEVGDMVIHEYSESKMSGLIVEIVTWRHTDNTTPFVLWTDGRVSKCTWALLQPVESKSQNDSKTGSTNNCRESLTTMGKTNRDSNTNKKPVSTSNTTHTHSFRYPNR